MVAKITLEQVMAAVEADAFLGFCVACGAEHEGLEPDARRAHCDICGKNKVYGAEEILMMLVA